MNIRVLLLSLIVTPVMSFAMDEDIEKAKYIEMNRAKVERQKEYNALVEQNNKNTEEIKRLIQRGDYDAALSRTQQIAELNDNRPMKITRNKLTKLTKDKQQTHQLPGLDKLSNIK
jgi:hypothetical protein